MAQKTKVTPLGLEFVQGLKSAIRDAEILDAATLSHRVPISTPGTPTPVTYTINITRVPDGSYLGTCFEIPWILTVADTEDEALLRARLAIFNFVHRRKPPKPPF